MRRSSAAHATQAKQRHVIHVDGEAMLLLHRFEQNLQQVVLTFHHDTANAAHQMMMRLIVDDFVVHLPAPVQGVNQAHSHKKSSVR